MTIEIVFHKANRYKLALGSVTSHFNNNPLFAMRLRWLISVNRRRVGKEIEIETEIRLLSAKNNYVH